MYEYDDGDDVMLDPPSFSRPRSVYLFNTFTSK